MRLFSLEEANEGSPTARPLAETLVVLGGRPACAVSGVARGEGLGQRRRCGAGLRAGARPSARPRSHARGLEISPSSMRISASRSRTSSIGLVDFPPTAATRRCCSAGRSARTESGSGTASKRDTRAGSRFRSEERCGVTDGAGQRSDRLPSIAGMATGQRKRQERQRGQRPQAGARLDAGARARRKRRERTRRSRNTRRVALLVVVLAVIAVMVGGATAGLTGAEALQGELHARLSRRGRDRAALVRLRRERIRSSARSRRRTTASRSSTTRSRRWLSKATVAIEDHRF